MYGGSNLNPNVKVQLEKCKSAHLDYISKKEDVTMDDNTWIEEVFKLYESYNTKVYQYLQRLSET